MHVGIFPEVTWGKLMGNAGFRRTRNAGVNFDPSTLHEREDERSADRGMMMKGSRV
jgi:hypothetical protein